MKKPKTEAFKDEVSSNQRFQYIDEFPINLHSMKDIEDNQVEIENELENIFKSAFNKVTVSPNKNIADDFYGCATKICHQHVRTFIP